MATGITANGNAVLDEDWFDTFDQITAFRVAFCFRGWKKGQPLLSTYGELTCPEPIVTARAARGHRRLQPSSQAVHPATSVALPVDVHRCRQTVDTVAMSTGVLREIRCLLN
jgi:hypothetical protein